MRAVAAISPPQPSRSPADLEANQLFARIWEWTTGADVSAIESFSKQAASLQSVGAGVWPLLLPGTPAEQERLLRLLSPVNHVGAHCPPTLIVHGTHDSLVRVGQSRDLKRRLEDCGVPVVLVELAETEHGFDLMLSDLAPAGRAARYDLERFLAVLM